MQKGKVAPVPLTPYERAVLALLWQIAYNTCPTVPDNEKPPSPTPEELLAKFGGAGAVAPRMNPSTGPVSRPLSVGTQTLKRG